MHMHNFLQSLQINPQCQFFAMMGQILNEELYKHSVLLHKSYESMTMKDLIKYSKEDAYRSSDPRIQSFFSGATQKSRKGFRLFLECCCSVTVKNVC